MKKLLEKYKSMPLAVKASGWYIVCNVLQNALGFLTLPVFTRLLTTDEYGLYTIYQSWMSILVIFTTLNIQYGVFNTAMVKFEKERAPFISSMQGLTTVISVVWLLLYLSLHNLWDSLFELPSIVMIAMAVEMCFLPAKDFWCNRKRFEFQYKGVVVYTLALSLINPLICILAVKTSEQKGVARILAAVAVNFCFYIGIYVYNFYKGKKFFDKVYWKYALQFGIPLIVYYLSQMIFNQSDKIMIQHLVGRDKAGIYGLVHTCCIVVTFVINAINSAFVPWKYQKMQEKKYQEISRVSNLLSLSLGGILLMVILGGPELVKLIATEEYYEAVFIMPPVVGSLYFLFQSQLFINLEFYYEEKSCLVKGAILSAVLNIILNYLAIPRFGYVAAGYTTLVVNIVFALCNYYYMRKICRERIGEEPIFQVRVLLCMGTVFLLCTVGIALFYEHAALRWGILGAALLVTMINAKRIWRRIGGLLNGETKQT